MTWISICEGFWSERIFECVQFKIIIIIKLNKINHSCDLSIMI